MLESHCKTLEKKILSVEAMNKESYQCLTCMHLEMKHEDIDITNLKDLLIKNEMKLINEKCNEIIQGLLVKSEELNCSLEDAYKEQERCAMMLDIQLYGMRVKFKEKAFERMKRKVMHKEYSDESSYGISIEESELNYFEEQCEY